MRLFFLICIFVMKKTFGQIVYRGKCKDSPADENFNMTRFSGIWHETSRSFTFFELLMRCVQTEYLVSEKGKIEIKIHGLDAIGASRSFKGKAEVKDPKEPSKYKAKFNIMPMSMNYDIIKTDYDNYAVIWSCNNIFGGRLGHNEQLWIMSRQPVLDDYVKSQIYDFLDKHSIRRRFLEGNARQAKCFPNNNSEIAEVIPINGTSSNNTDFNTNTVNTTTILTTST